MNLPLVNVFHRTYKKFRYVSLTHQEIMSRNFLGGKFIDTDRKELVFTISNPYTAAMYMCKVGADNSLGNHVEESLERDENFKKMLSLMPEETPDIFIEYKLTPNMVNSTDLHKAILNINMSLSKNQYLYHGGLWGNDRESIITQRPLSTSFCPQVALRNAEHNDKAFDAGRLDLFVIMVVESSTPVFVYPEIEDTVNEKEVLFASGARLKKKWEHKITDNYRAPSKKHEHKKIPAYIIFVEMS
ncbi:hypothetical protein ACK3YV_07350 [Aeromonas caviae]